LETGNEGRTKTRVFGGQFHSTQGMYVRNKSIAIIALPVAVCCTFCDAVFYFQSGYMAAGYYFAAVAFYFCLQGICYLPAASHESVGAANIGVETDCVLIK